MLIWALTSRSYFWPVWVALPLAAAFGIHAWFVLIAERPALSRRFRGSRALAVTVGVGAVAASFFVAIWAITGHGYFWPVWPILVIALAIVAQAAVALLTSPREAELTERIETLESTRAGAVDVQECELRRIERDLHDGAQARLVALGMSLGMAEHTLTDDPRRAGELLAEARVGAEQALRELRDLARGIHPPVLADRGLQAAIAALASSSPTQVSLSVDVARAAPCDGRERRLLRRRRGAGQRVQARTRDASGDPISSASATPSRWRSPTTESGARTPPAVDCADCATASRRSTGPCRS